MGMGSVSTLCAGAGLLLVLAKMLYPKKAKDLSNEDSVLAELEVLESYGHRKQARKLLKEALAIKPKSWAYRDRLARLERY